MKLVSLDLSLAATGYATWDGAALDFGTLRPERGVIDMSRLNWIRSQVGNARKSLILFLLSGSARLRIVFGSTRGLITRAPKIVRSSSGASISRAPDARLRRAQMPKNIEVQVGQKYGRLVVVAEVTPTSFIERPNKAGRVVPYRRRRFLFACECGVQKEINLTEVRSGNVSSCGCLQRETWTAARPPDPTTHGGSGTSEYACWESMRYRCSNPKVKHFERYGGRGISVCPQWSDFAVFLRDVGPRPSMLHTLDRYPNRDGNYEPGNVRWANPIEQVRNRSNNVYLTVDGETLLAIEWAERLNLSRHAVLKRIRQGRPLEEILSPFPPSRKGMGKKS